MKSTSAFRSESTARNAALTCDYCRGTALQPLAVAEVGSFWKCPSCGLLQRGSSMRRDVLSLADAAREVEAADLRHAEIRLSRVAAHVSAHRPRLLDVAQQVSPTLEQACRMGWSATAVFECPSSVTAYRRRGYSVSHAPATHLPFPTGFFDVVTASFVIERVADARSALEEWQRVLRPGGVLAIEALRATSLRNSGTKLPRQAKVLPLRYGFTPQNLQGLLREINFELLSGTGLGRLELLGLRSAVVSMCHQTYHGLLRLVGRDATFEVFCRRGVLGHEVVERRRAA